MLGKNFFGTKNNPKESLTEFMLVLKQMDPICARAQYEKGENGTPHFQWMVSLKKSTRLPKMHKLLPGCHVELAKNAMASWNYCGKADGRIEGPEEIGLPPASKAVKGDTKARNALILEKGAMWAVEEGHVPIEKF